MPNESQFTHIICVDCVFATSLCSLKNSKPLEHQCPYSKQWQWMKTFSSHQAHCTSGRWKLTPAKWKIVDGSVQRSTAASMYTLLYAQQELYTLALQHLPHAVSLTLSYMYSDSSQFSCTYTPNQAG